MAIRTCTTCEHSELFHFGRNCAGLIDWQCFCPGFSARELTQEERLIIARELGRPRGQIGDAEVLDEYSAIREHLADVMEKASK